MTMSSMTECFANETVQDVSFEDVRQLNLVSKGISAQELSGSGFTYRHDWGDRSGQQILTLNWNVITANSRVFVAVGEGAAGGGKFVGNARFTVHNIAPSDGKVSIRVNIEWDSPIRLYVDYLIVNP